MNGRRVARLDALTSLRFIAASMVMVNHVRGHFGVPTTGGDPFPFQQGVTFFFVLSGFILTYVYPSLTWREAPRFWWSRIARIWPAHVVGMLLLIVLMSPSSLRAEDTIQTGIANLLLVHAWIPTVAYFGSFNAPSWSVSTELGFYLLFPLLIADLRRTWAWKLALSLVLLVGLGVVANSIASQPLLKENQIHVYGLVYVSPLARLFEFVLGMCTCLLWLRIRESRRLTPLWCTIGEIVAIGLTIVLLYRLGANGRLWTAWLGQAGHTWLVHGGGGALGFAAIILVIALNRGLVARLLSLPLLVLLGEMSYSVYLVHQPLIKAGITYPWFATLPNWFTLPTFWIVTLVLSYTIWRFVEYPARQLMVGMVGGSATQPGLAWAPRQQVPRQQSSPASPTP